jgi:ribosomal protein S18 acetylase RimI-like enzyme
MNILDLRQIRSTELAPVLEEESRVWEEELRWDYRGSSELIRRFVDARALAGYAALEGGRVVGYSFFVYEEHKSLIGNLFISRSYCGRTEDLLLSHVIETIQATPGVERIEAQLMTFPSEALDPVFRQDGFRSFRRQFMVLDVPSAPALPQAEAAGMRLVPWSEEHMDEGALLITQAYRDHVDSEINDQYRTPPGAHRFLRNIISYPGCGSFHGPASFMAFHKASGRLVGMVLTSVVYPRVGHVTQVCVAPEFHGCGVGYELMRLSVEAFRSAAFDAVSLTVTSENRRAVRLYEQMGFVTRKEFSAYVWGA